MYKEESIKEASDLLYSVAPRLCRQRIFYVGEYKFCEVFDFSSL